MAEMLFRTQGEVMDYLHALGLKISRSKLSQDYRNGSLRCQADKTFLEADVLAYAETLKAPASQEKKDKVARLREELDAHNHVLLRLFKAIPDAGALKKSIAKWLEREGKEADANLRTEAEEALGRLRAAAPRVMPERQPEHMTRDADAASSSPLSPEFKGLCLGVLADGVIHPSEAELLARWLEENLQADAWAMRQLRQRLERIRRKDSFSSRDGKDLCKTLKGLIGGDLPEWLHDTVMPEQPRYCAGRRVREVLMLTPEIPGLYDAVSEIDWNAAFCFTGIFAFGERNDCEEQARKMGGVAVQRPIKVAPCYVVVGSVASPDWAHGCYGRKIELAMRYREEGAPLKIISEDMWMTAA